jgi:hypothetical protein
MRTAIAVLAASLLLTACASRQADYWRGVSNGVGQVQGR